MVVAVVNMGIESVIIVTMDTSNIYTAHLCVKVNRSVVLAVVGIDNSRATANATDRSACVFVVDCYDTAVYALVNSSIAIGNNSYASTNARC